MENREVVVKKSIFIQRTVRKVYEFKIKHEQSQRMGNGIYPIYSNEIVTGVVADYVEVNSGEVIFTCNLEMPLLEHGDSFYIEELGKLVKIKNAVRTSQENMCYYIEDKVIEDEISKESKIKAEEKEKTYLTSDNEVRRLTVDFHTLRREKDSISNELEYIKDSLRYKLLWRGR